MQVFGPPTIDAASFAAVLQAAGSPVLKERPAAEYYALCVAYGQDPAFWLAIFRQESQYGTAAAAVVNRYGTRSWGNTRTVRKPGLSGAVVQTDRGPFVKYGSWLAGLEDCCYRVGVAPYLPNRTVETIIPIWSPTGDQDNNSAAYVAAVLASMRQWATPQGKVMQYADSVQLIPASNSNRPGTKLTGFHAFTIHETANENPGAGAVNTHDYVVGRFGPPPDASFHFTADAQQSIQLLPIDEVGWHIGDGADDPLRDEAFYTVAIEICVNSRAGFPAACAKAASVVAKVLHDRGVLPVIDQTVRQHGSYWSPQNPGVHSGCPQHLKAGDWGVTWLQFFGMVQAAYAALEGASKVPVEKVPGSGEADALKAYGETIPFEYRGNLLREGAADLSAFGGSASEWVCFYERLIAHRLNGHNFVMTLGLFGQLRAGGKLHSYPDFPY